MNQLILLLSFLPLGVASFLRPWIGVVIYYSFAILSPESIWPDLFAKISPAQWIILPTLAGFAFKVHRGGYWAATVVNTRNALLVFLWVAFVIACFFGAYVGADRAEGEPDAFRSLEALSKMLLLYFLGSICIDRERRLRVLFLSFAACVGWLAFSAYLQEAIEGVGRRVVGAVNQDGLGRWSDPNYFAALFVVGLPVLWHLGFALKNRFARLACWLVIPLALPVVFWTGSRGGLLSLALVTLLLALRSRYKLLGLLFVPFVVGVFLVAGNEVAFERADSIAQYKDDDSALDRLDAARAAIRMIIAHPLFGVGPGSFLAAFPNFSNQVPLVAHNTLLQITAEAGVPAGLATLAYILHCLHRLWTNGSRLRRLLPKAHDSLYWMNEAALGALVGFSACAMFLSLQLFHLLYLVCLFAGSVIYLGDRRIATIGAATARQSAGRPPRRPDRTARGTRSASATPATDAAAAAAAPGASPDRQGEPT